MGKFVICYRRFSGGVVWESFVIRCGRSRGEGGQLMSNLRHLLSSVQRGGVLVSFFICCRRSRKRVRVREWESIVIFVVHSAGLG